MFSAYELPQDYSERERLRERSLATSASPHFRVYLCKGKEQKIVSPAPNPAGVTLLLPRMRMMTPGTKRSQIQHAHTHTPTCRLQRGKQPNYDVVAWSMLADMCVYV